MPADHGSCVVQPTWLSISVMNCSIFDSGALGLLALDADQRGLVLLVGEPDLERAVGQERENDHGNHSATYLMNRRLRTIEAPTAGPALP